MVHVNFVAQFFKLPLKTEASPLNPFTEKNLYDILALLFGFVFLNRDEVQAFKVRTLAIQACEALSLFVKTNVKEVALAGVLQKLVDGIRKDGFLDSYGNSFVRRLLGEGMSMEEIIWIFMPTAAAATANQGQQVFPSTTLLIPVYSNA
jgi:linoleate 8R-lipoxygenase / 9,12-octadecadienoate 8-hydroperoxide 8R-isomerase